MSCGVIVARSQALKILTCSGEIRTDEMTFEICQRVFERQRIGEVC
jgi:hypothetical protein